MWFFVRGNLQPIEASPEGFQTNSCDVSKEVLKEDSVSEKEVNDSSILELNDENKGSRDSSKAFVKEITRPWVKLKLHWF